MLIGSAFIVPLGIYFWKCWDYIKDSYRYILIIPVSALFESYKKLKASKCSLKQLKKLKSQVK